MSNYTPTGAPPVETRGISVSMRSEFQLIAAAIASKADSSGTGGYTGTQDFTGATILVPTLNFGAHGSNAASIDYVNNAAFQVVLPGQSGNAGKFLMTDGTSASWGATLGTALNEAKGIAPSLSATPDIWGAGGNYVPITQTTAISGFPNAPQAGARRTLQIGATVGITSGASLIVHGGSTVLLAGDEVDVVADAVNIFRATVRRDSGITPPYFSAKEIQPSGTAGVVVSSSGYTNRALNSLLFNSINGASFSSPGVTLPAGVYQVRARASYAVNNGTGSNYVGHKVSLYNITDSTFTIVGSNEFVTSSLTVDSLVSGQFSISSSKTFCLRHYTNSGNLGNAVSSGQVEVYSEIEIYKVG